MLAGCAGGGDAAKNYVGDWKLVGMEENGEATSADDIKLMEDMGLSVTMSVKEDKTFSMNVMGEEMSGPRSPSRGRAFPSLSPTAF